MKHTPKVKPKETRQKTESQNWLGWDLLVIISLPSLDAIEGQILSAIHSGVNMWVVGYLIAGCLVGIAIFLRGNEHYEKFKKLSKWTSRRKSIRYLPTIGIIILVVIRVLYPALGENSASNQDGIYGNTYINRTLGLQIERPDDTWMFIANITGYEQTHGIPHGSASIGGIMVGRSHSHDAVSIWVIDPIKINFSSMADYINRTLNALPPVIHSPLYNVKTDISPDDNYATYTYESDGVNGSKIYHDVVIQLLNGKLYERNRVSGMPDMLSQNVTNDIEFIIHHYEILNQTGG